MQSHFFLVGVLLLENPQRKERDWNASSHRFFGTANYRSVLIGMLLSSRCNWNHLQTRPFPGQL